MGEMTLGIIIGGAFSLLTVFIPAILNYNKTRGEANKLHHESEGVTAETYLKLSRRIDELETRDSEKEKRIDWLEGELKRYVNGYSKAILFINQHVNGINIPNFLETDPRLKAAK